MSENQPETTIKKVKRWIQYRYSGPRNRFFIQGLVISSKLGQFAVMGMLMAFLTDDLGMKLTHAAVIVNVHDGLTAFTSIGALSLANLVGRYPVLVTSSCFHSMGMVRLSLSALPTYFKDKSSRFHTVLSWLSKLGFISFYMGLFLITLAIAGQSASLKEFLAYQISAHYEKDEKRAKACTQFHMLVGMLIALTLSYYLASFNWALVIGAIALSMTFATAVFTVGTPFYSGIKTGETPLSCGPGLPVSHQNTQLEHRNYSEDRNQFTSVPTTNNPRGSAEVATCASSPHGTNREQKKLEEVGKTRPIYFMLTTFIIVGLVSTIGNTFFIEQANALHNTRFPVFILLVCNSISRSTTSHGCTFLLKKLSKSPAEQSLGIRIRIGVGMLLFLLCSSIANMVETKRLGVVTQHGLQDKPNEVVPMSVSWLVPQFILLGSAEGLSWDGLEDFLDEQLPESKKMYASSLTKGMNGVGKIVGVICVLIVEAIDPSWFSDSINRSHLDEFYRMLTIFSLLNLLWYVFVAKYLTRKEVINDV